MLKNQGYIQSRLAFLNTQIIESLQGVEFLDRLVEQTPAEWENTSPRVTQKGNWNLVGTKFSLGQIFLFLDLQDCLASLRSADNCPVDLGK